MRTVEHITSMEEAPVPDNVVKTFTKMDRNWRRVVGVGTKQAPHLMRDYLARCPQPKGRYFQVEFQKRSLDVFLFAAEGTSLYLNLFAMRGTAPRILCIKNSGNAGGEWTHFGKWQGPLGRTVREGRIWPKLLLAREGDHDWPWGGERFEDWEDRAVILSRREGEH
jgi:hypothetical protein